MKKTFDLRLWAARLLIAVVVAWNLQCALVFLLNSGGFARGFELSGVAGEVGLIGESILLSTIPAGHAILRGSILRFILFDGAGVLLLGVAAYLSRERLVHQPNHR